MRSFLVLTSPAAGNTEDDLLAPALDVLRTAGTVEVVETGSPADLDVALARHGEQDRSLVVAGGDGSLHAVVNALHRRGELDGTTLGLLPLGTGNDFARGLGLPTDPAEAARVIVHGTPRPLDVLVDGDDSVVVNSVHAGAGAEAARAASGWKERLGKLGYAVGAVRSVVSPAEVRLRVEVDGAVVCTPDTPILQVAVGNGRYVGGGAPLTPAARPDDGRADVLIAATVGLRKRLVYAVGLLAGRHHLHPDVTTLAGQRVRVEGRDFWCSEDGELTGPHQRREWRVVRSAYSIQALAAPGAVAGEVGVLPDPGVHGDGGRG